MKINLKQNNLDFSCDITLNLDHHRPGRFVLLCQWHSNNFRKSSEYSD